MKLNDLLTLDEMKERICAQFSEEELLDILSIDIFELVDILEEYIIDSADSITEQLYD